MAGISSRLCNYFLVLAPNTRVLSHRRTCFHRVNQVCCLTNWSMPWIRWNSYKVGRFDNVLKDKEIVAVVSDKNTFIGLKELHEMQKTARKKNMKLVKLSDKANNEKHSIYQLLPAHQLKDGSVKAPQMEKTMYLTANITEHDLATKLRSLNKWLQKGAVIRVVVTASGQDPSALQGVLSAIEKHIEDCGKIAQKSVKNTVMKLTIQQLKKAAPTTEENNIESEKT